MKLIEIKRAKEFASTFFGDPILKWAVNKVFDNAPCFELVQCKDCKHYHTMEEGFKDCINPLGIDMPQEGDFCSYGERKDND